MPEPGTELVNELFTCLSSERRTFLLAALGEVLSIIVRKRNAGTLPAAPYRPAAEAFRAELVAVPGVWAVPVTDPLVFTSLPLIETHSINATDALVMRSALDTAAALRTAGDDLVLVAADARLLRTAAREGLAGLDPENSTLERLRELVVAP